MRWLTANPFGIASVLIIVSLLLTAAAVGRNVGPVEIAVLGGAYIATITAVLAGCALWLLRRVRQPKGGPRS
jgi:hypothetical protein